MHWDAEFYAGKQHVLKILISKQSMMISPFNFFGHIFLIATDMMNLTLDTQYVMKFSISVFI